jgi:hypothetical protein
VGILSAKEQKLPYGYKAIIKVFKDEDYCDTDCKGGFYTDMEIHYYADTLCSLGRLLRERESDPSRVRIYEIKKELESEVPRTSYTKEDGSWRSKSAMCESNKRYGAAPKKS